MANVTTQIIAAGSGPWSQVRTGTVAAATLGSATVVVGGTAFQASYVLPFGVAPSSASIPQVGDLVSIVRQDASWQILGRIAGAGPNLIQNGSFEASGPGDFPEDWILYNITSSSSAVVTDTVAVDGGRSALVLANTGVTAESYLYSSPVPVTAGDVMSLSAYAGASFGNESPVTVDAGLYALWFASDTAVYPTTSSADSLVAAVAGVPEAPPFTPLSGTVMAPVTGFMRLALRSTVADVTGMLWDFAVVRRNEN